MTGPFACDLSAIPAAERGTHQQVTRRMVSGAIAIRESGDGLVLTFAADEHETVTQFVSRERLCCPFLTFVVAAAPEAQQVELLISGPRGAKEFIRAELHLPR
ncbi:MAG TPA: hypothetical protein VK573_11505 [Gemmatimonadales bacterium]|nr:hypothetical protein [Gemmatimonadales bacterium]